MLKFNHIYLKQRRNELNISMQEMAELLGFKNASTYYKYEKGEYSLKAELLPTLAKILECKINDFFCL